MTPPIQDVAPAGGFPALTFESRVPKSRGPSGLTLWIGSVLLTSYGLYMVGQTNIEARKHKHELRLMRAAIAPFLQAEEDVRMLRRLNKHYEEEKRIMKDVPGWEVGKRIYHTQKWNPPRLYYIDEE